MAEAPRFRAYFEYAQGRPVLHMPRQEWNTLNVSSSETVLIDIDKTPMAGVASDASVVATYGQRFSSATAEVGVIRHDPGDAPDIYNTDKYEVYEDLPSHRSFKDVITAASTGDNDNLREYLRQTILFVKQVPDKDHHDLPPFSWTRG